MGDATNDYSRHIGEYSTVEGVAEGRLGPASTYMPSSHGSTGLTTGGGAGERPLVDDAGTYAFHSQYTSIRQPPQRSGNADTSIAYGADRGEESFNLAPMASALPDYGSPGLNYASSRQYQPQRTVPPTSNPVLLHQLPQMSQYSASAGYGQGHNAGSHAQQTGVLFSGRNPQQGNQSFSAYPMNHQRSTGPSPLQQTFSTHPQHLFYYPSPYDPASQLQQTAIQHRGSNMLFGQGGVAFHGPSSSAGFAYSGRMGYSTGLYAETGERGSSEGMRRQASESSTHSGIPRGPPRKPKQSGHALWVGNLPPGSTIMNLKDHFSREATRDIESLFLISKSNCAFVNYKSEAACVAAMNRFHDSRFHGVRLVCRLRRGSTGPALNAPVAPAAMTRPRQAETSPARSPTRPAGGTRVSLNDEPSELLVEGEVTEEPRLSDRFFIVKSLTLQDLELSVRTGIWATQAHNEEALNKAFESAENVYLIFSANKSGEYFGYARMISAISDESAQSSTPAPTETTHESSDGPRSIPTPATEFAPRGHIIDDSTRGTIFWEADADNSDEEDKALDDSHVEGAEGSDDEAPTMDQAWGKPFKIEWITTNRVPFYRTRGLRNLWNANREVKIARDGTELETNVGKRLVQMFHKVGPVPPLGPTVNPIHVENSGMHPY